MTAIARLHTVLGETDQKSRRHIVTPEGVALPVELAGRSERAAAFLIDLLIMVACFVVLILLALAAGLNRFESDWIWIVLLLMWFIVRSFYFALFELRWQGSTPGKRVFHLRVIDRAGGALSADAVIARNLMREVEVFLPITLILVGMATEMHGLLQLAMLGWMLILTFMPLFNRDRLRVGDMVGGTWVIVAPKAALLPDLAEAGGQPMQTGQPSSPHQFSTEQLDAYGIYELQTLEQVLRQQGPNAAGVREEVARRIQRKINWQPPAGTSFDALA
ncbi:MAG: RDD family protein, partial [Dongiaceae bacterium]